MVHDAVERESDHFAIGVEDVGLAKARLPDHLATGGVDGRDRRRPNSPLEL
jgi:hypothetical protein